MAGIPDYMKRVVGWDQTTTAVEERQPELVHLDNHRLDLEGISERYKELSAQYKNALATKLDLSKELQEEFRKGEALVNFIRTGVRVYYGSNSEQLFAFGLVPTGRRAPRATNPPPVEASAEPVPALVPDPAK